MKKILVCLDGSPRERSVLDAAVAVGRRSAARLVLFRSVGIPQELPAAAYSMTPDEIPTLLEGLALASLQTLEGAVPSELRGGTRVLIGTPWQAIERAAAEEDIDLIIVGSHGYHAVDQVLGTTASKVVNHADRSVLVVRAPERLSRT